MAGMKKYILAAALWACVLGGCQAAPGTAKEAGLSGGQIKDGAAGEADSLAPDSMTFEEMKQAAEGTTVTFYGWGGDEKLNDWLDHSFAPFMEEKYDIFLERVPMDIDQILSQLAGEMQAGVKEGSIDMIWINGENFRSAKENGMLYGPFTEKLPNFNKYVDGQSEDTTLDFAFPIEGYEAPWGKAQLVFTADKAVVSDVPESAEELLEFAKEHPGMVTYPAPPDFTGSAFVRNIIYEICGYEQFLTMEPDKETVRKAVAPAMEYLRELNPWLWNKGQTFPDSVATFDNMFADGEIILSMTYDTYSTALKIEDGVYPETAENFLFDQGTVGNTNFIAIAANSGNKPGAMVAINEMLSLEIQAERYEKLKVIPVLAMEKLSMEEREVFSQGELPPGGLSPEELTAKRLPEMPAELVPLIEEIWMEEVVGK